jgi:CheY-like chemotaxis protein
MQSPGTRVISVLVADDDEDQRLLLEGILEGADWASYDVTAVQDGRAALTALRERVFDVALLDLSMPGLGGLDVLEAIRDDPHRPQVIFVSGTGTVATATRAMKLGAYDFLEKPVRGERLVALVWKAAEARATITKSERLGAVMKRGAADAGRCRDAGWAHAAGARAGGQSRLVRRLRAGRRRVGHGQGALRARGPPAVPPPRRAARRPELRRGGRDARRVRALRAREGSLHRRRVSGRSASIELADSGTLFLDEIGDLSLPLQAKLLRVLESKHFRRVGGVKEFPTDFRLVSATNRPLAGAGGEGGVSGRSLLPDQRGRDRAAAAARHDPRTSRCSSTAFPAGVPAR